MAINANRETLRLKKMKDLGHPEYIANCEAALARQEATYPAKLKRHLSKCRKYGWTDSRISAKKK